MKTDCVWFILLPSSFILWFYMSRIVLIQAGPTKWDVENRLVGNHPLPLTEQAAARIDAIARNLQSAVSAIYRYRKNEACDQAAKIVAAVVNVKPSDNSGLDEMNLGLWQGLTRAELRFRHPKAFGQWEENPLLVNPPDGEMLATAIERVYAALRRILRRRRGVTVVLCLRPVLMQIALGLLQHEEPSVIARHLQNTAAVATITLDHEELLRFIS
jgi:broad specificity phosphatase PhoE